MRTTWGLLTLTLALSACVDASSESDPIDIWGDDGKEDRGGAPAFLEVNPAHTSSTFRRYIGRALTLLEASDSRVAKLTFASIRDGRVRIDELADLTCWDFERARQEIAPDDPGATAETLSAEIDGYMWSNRVYVSRGLSAKRLAATLVHEVNHVINRSEVGYFDDLPTSAFLHEYRAFHAERLFDPDSYAGVDLVEHVIDLYELDGELIPDTVRQHPLTPRTLPDAEAWRLRRVEDDPVERDEDCPGLSPPAG
jgi:hypothetical protein